MERSVPAPMLRQANSRIPPLDPFVSPKIGALVEGIARGVVAVLQGAIGGGGNRNPRRGGAGEPLISRPYILPEKANGPGSRPDRFKPTT